MINNKPIFLWPFILVYRTVTLVMKFPILFVRYFCLGFFFIVYFTIEQIVTLISVVFKYGFFGLLFLCYIVYNVVKIIANGFFKLLKYFVLGLAFPFVAIYKSYNDENAKEKRNALKEEKNRKQEVKTKEKEINKQILKQQRIDQQALAEKKKQEVLSIKQEKEQSESRKLKNEEKAKARQEKLEKQTLEKQQQAEARKLKNEKKAKAKQEKLEKQTLAKQQKDKPKVEEKQDIQTTAVENEQATKEDTKSEGKFEIHAPKNDILLEEKQDEVRQNKVLTKEERQQLKLEKKLQKQAEKEAKRLEKLNKPKLTKKEKQEIKAQREAERREEKLRRAEEKKKRQEKLNDIYVNENVTIEKESLSDKISKGLNEFNHLPEKFRASFEKKWNNLSFVKHARNKEDMNRQALLINFEGDDAVKSDKKLVYEYVAKNPDGKVIKGYFEAFSKVEVHSFLLSEGFEVYSIKTDKLIQLLHGTHGTSNGRIKTKDLIFFLTQLSTYIKAGIPLVDSLKILSRQYKNKNYERIFSSIIYDLTMGENFSEALSKQGNAFPRLLINMVKASEMTGELPEALDDMADYYTETDKTRKQMITAMMYPSIVFIIAIAATTFIMVYVVPQFVEIYATMDNARLPWITQFIVSLSAFLEKNLAMILIVTVLVIGILVYAYKKVKIFRTIVQFIIMHLPVFGNVIIYNEVTMFTKTFCSLLKHNVFITDSMEILNKITTNEIYKMIILDTITNLARGEKISLAFKDHWAVPMPAYEMIVTGERTGQLPEMMGKVSAYYQEMHRNATARIKTFIEPMLILFLTGIVGVIVVSIIVPMFDMYNNMGL